MPAQVFVIIFTTIFFYNVLQASILEVSSRNYRALLGDEITRNFNLSKDSTMNHLKVDSLTAKTQSFMTIRKQIMEKTSVLISEIVSSN